MDPRHYTTFADEVTLHDKELAMLLDALDILESTLRENQLGVQIDSKRIEELVKLRCRLQLKYESLID